MSASRELINSGNVKSGIDDDVVAQSLLEGVLGSTYHCDPILDKTSDSVGVQAGPVKLWRVLTDRDDDRIKNEAAAQSAVELTGSTPAWLQLMCAGIEEGKLVLPGATSIDHPNEDGLIEVKLDDEMAASTAAWLQSMLTQIGS